MIKYKITGLNLSQLLRVISQNNFYEVIEELKKAPKRLTTGITHLIPKSGDNKEVRNY